VKAFLVAYEFKELHKKLNLKIIKAKYIRGYPNWLAIQMW
jgi:hypothetical protein